MFDKENIMRIDFTHKWGNIEMKMVALFNKNKITESEVNDIIEMKPIGEYDNVIVISESQFNNVFLKND